jgi:DNA primase
MVTFEDLIARLQAKRVGSTWMAKCPAHDDRNPSLSINQKNGKILVKCFAGCEQQQVIAALTVLGLWESISLSFDQRFERVYQYSDEYGNPLYEVVRLHSPKEFRQRYADNGGRYTWKKHPRQVLYRLREVLESPVVFVVEGEKDVETLRANGFAATTNAGGAKAPWLPQYTDALRGREVIIIPDNDSPGWSRAKTIAASLLGHAGQIIVLNDIHNDLGVKDITDWFARGHSECELISLLEEVHAR